MKSISFLLLLLSLFACRPPHGRPTPTAVPDQPTPTAAPSATATPDPLAWKSVTVRLTGAPAMTDANKADLNKQCLVCLPGDGLQCIALIDRFYQENYPAGPWDRRLRLEFPTAENAEQWFGNWARCPVIPKEGGELWVTIYWRGQSVRFAVGGWDSGPYTSDHAIIVTGVEENCSIPGYAPLGSAASVAGWSREGW